MKKKTYFHWANLQVGIISSSTFLDRSDCSVVIRWTACQRVLFPIVSVEASDKPMYFILASSTSFLSSPNLLNTMQNQGIQNQQIFYLKRVWNVKHMNNTRN